MRLVYGRSMQHPKAALTIRPPLNALNLTANALEAAGSVSAPKQSPKTRATTDIAILGIGPPNMVFKPRTRADKAAETITGPSLPIYAGARANEPARAIGSPMHL